MGSNNNYHTQIDNKNNMLHEIAANNHLLQNYPGMHYQGTPINNQQLPNAYQNQEEIELSDTKTEKKVRFDPETQKINQKIQQVLQNKSNIPSKIGHHFRRGYPYPPPPKYFCVPKQENKMVEYIVVPILLIIIFVIIVHPKTSGYLDKFLPKSGMKGYLSRGLVLAIAYLIIRLVVDFMRKTPDKGEGI